MTDNPLRLIKKYPNRRLYDTEVSSYITLEDVKKLVISNVPFRIVDARSQEDLTHSTLLQIIAEQEEQGTPLLSTNVLHQMIKTYGNSMQGFMSQFMDEALSFLQKQGTPLTPPSPLQFMQAVTEQNMDFWKKIQSSFYRPPSGEKKSEPSESDSGN